MAQFSSGVGISPLTWGAAEHAAVQRLSPLFTGNRPRPRSGSPHRADLRQAWTKRLRPAHQCGRWNPYATAKASLAAARSILPLMASIVLSPVRRLLLAALGLPTLLAPCRLAAGPGAVTLATVAATTDGERAPAAPTVAKVKNRNLARQHRRLRRQGAPWTTAARLCQAPSWVCWSLGSALSGIAETNRKPRRQPGFSLARRNSAKHTATTRPPPPSQSTPSSRRASRGMMMPLRG